MQAAISIQQLIRAYRDAFTLRRAPYLLSYATYCALAVILRQKHSDRVSYLASIKFFWSALSELQRGCNFGLKKAISILRETMQELEEHVSAADLDGNAETSLSSLAREYMNPFDEPASEQSNMPPLMLGNGMYDDFTYSAIGEWGDSLDGNGTLNDTLYGLFDPSAF